MEELKIIFKTFSDKYDAISKANVWDDILYLYCNWCDLAYFHVQGTGYNKAFVFEIVDRFENGKYPFN